jgi:hypothetical protein
MTWLETARGIEALEVADLDPALVGALETRARPGPVNFHVPTFKAFATSEISGCGKSAWPAVSITGGDCGRSATTARRRSSSR